MDRQMTGLVLAGGRSRRMGADKALISVDGRTLVARAGARLATVCTAVLVAPGRRRIAGLPWPQVDDRIGGEGPLAGILAGLAAATTPLVAVVAVDMPDCDPRLLTRLARAWCGHVAVVPVHDGTPQPLHAVYATAALPNLAAAFDGGERSPTRALRRAAALHLDVAATGAWSRSIDTPGDLGSYLLGRAAGDGPGA